MQNQVSESTSEKFLFSFFSKFFGDYLKHGLHKENKKVMCFFEKTNGFEIFNNIYYIKIF